MSDPGPILFGVDFSPGMRRAIPWVREFIAPGRSVVLAHAVDQPPVPAFLRNVLTPQRAADQACRAALEELAAFGDRAGASGARLVARLGRADTVLQAIAAEQHAELLVIGADGEVTRPWKRVGTTAERLLRGSDASVLVTRGIMNRPPKCVVAAVDDVDVTPAVLARAGSLADTHGAELYAVHVLSPAAYSHMLSAEAAEARDDAERRRRIEADLSSEALRWLRELWKNTLHHSHLHAEVPHGAPAEEILRIARERGADLIVIGRYGLGRALPALLGSVLGSVVAGADCPVLVVTR